VGPIALGIIHSDVEWLGMLLVFIGLILIAPFVRVFHSFIDDAASVFGSWKSNRSAAVNAADAFNVPTKIKQFIVKPILVFIFGLVYLVIALFRAIWHNLPWFIITIFFVFVFTYIEVWSGYIIDMTQVHLDLASSSLNAAGMYAGAGSDVFNIALPAYNAIWQNQLYTAVTFTSYLQSVSSGSSGINLFGRRLQEEINVTMFEGLNATERRQLQTAIKVANIAGDLGKSIQVAATFETSLNKIRLIVLEFGLVVIIPLLPYILPDLDFLIQRLMCLLIGMNGYCNVKEVVDYIIIGKINIIINLLNDILGVSIPYLDIACDATQLSGGPSCDEPGAFPADCTGNLGDPNYYGVYSRGCPIQRRLLCQQEGNATCEYVDGDLIHCHPDPMQGCPHTARSLTAAGNLLNIEDLKTHCYEICSNGTLLERCHGSFKNTGSCDSKGRKRHTNSTRRARPALFGKFINQPKVPKPDFSAIKAAGMGIREVSGLARIRALYYQETGDWEGTWAHSRATDKVPIFRKLDNIVRSFHNPALPILPKKQARRVLSNIISKCDDPSLQSCCSGACIPQGATCPAINPVSISEIWCQAVVDATNDVNTFDANAFLASIYNCVLNYEKYPDTSEYSLKILTMQIPLDPTQEPPRLQVIAGPWWDLKAGVGAASTSISKAGSTSDVEVLVWRPCNAHAPCIQTRHLITRICGLPLSHCRMRRASITSSSSCSS
jgi:hypothetical protein